MLGTRTGFESSGQIVLQVSEKGVKLLGCKIQNSKLDKVQASLD